MLSDKRIGEAESNVKQYLAEGFGGAITVDPDNPLEPGEIEEFIFDFEVPEEGIYEVSVTIHPVEEDFNDGNNRREENITVS